MKQISFGSSSSTKNGVKTLNGVIHKESRREQRLKNAHFLKLMKTIVRQNEKIIRFATHLAASNEDVTDSETDKSETSDDDDDGRDDEENEADNDADNEVNDDNKANTMSQNRMPIVDNKKTVTSKVRTSSSTTPQNQVHQVEKNAQKIKSPIQLSLPAPRQAAMKSAKSLAEQLKQMSNVKTKNIQTRRSLEKSTEETACPEKGKTPAKSQKTAENSSKNSKSKPASTELRFELIELGKCDLPILTKQSNSSDDFRQSYKVIYSILKRYRAYESPAGGSGYSLGKLKFYNRKLAIPFSGYIQCYGASLYNCKVLLKFEFDASKQQYKLYRTGKHNHEFNNKLTGLKWDLILEQEDAPEIEIWWTKFRSPVGSEVLTSTSMDEMSVEDSFADRNEFEPIVTIENVENDIINHAEIIQHSESIIISDSSVKSEPIN